MRITDKDLLKDLFKKFGDIRPGMFDEKCPPTTYEKHMDSLKKFID